MGLSNNERTRKLLIFFSIYVLWNKIFFSFQPYNDIRDEPFLDVLFSVSSKDINLKFYLNSVIGFEIIA